MNVKSIPTKKMQECITLFHNLRLYSDEANTLVYPNVYTCEKTEGLVVVAPHCIRLEQFEKAFEGLSSIFGRSIIGSKDLGTHCWLLLESKLPDIVPYSSRPNNIPQGSYWLGTYEDGSPVILAFEHSPVFLVAGASGSGKSELFKVLLKEIENTWGADCITIAEGTKDGNDFRHQPCKCLATELDEVLEVYQELNQIYEKRKKLIRELDVNNWLEARKKGHNWQPHYFLIDECPLFLSKPLKSDPDFETKMEIIRIASHLAMRGRYVGLFQILGAQDPSSTALPSDIINQVRLKVGYGMRTAEMARSYFGQTAPYANDLEKGKGIAMFGREPMLFRGAKSTTPLYY